MKIICFGDSNTYGYDPRSYFGSRYSVDCRWVDIIAARTDWEVHNDGMNGREIPRNAYYFPKDIDLLIVMLGTNDLLQGADPDTVSDRMEFFLMRLSIEKEKILLIAPPPMQPGEWVHNQSLINASLHLIKEYNILAQRLGIRFVDTGEWGIPLSFDGVHFSEKGHKIFAEGLLREIGV